MFAAALFTIAKMWKQSKYLLTDEWIKKMWYTYNGSLFRLKKEKILLYVTTWMNLEDTMLDQISQSLCDSTPTHVKYFLK